MPVTDQNNGYTYELPEVSPEFILTIRDQIRNLFLGVSDLFKRFRKGNPAGGSFCARDHTVSALTAHFKGEYPDYANHMERVVMLVILGHDALPQGDAVRWHNMSYYVPEGTKKALKDMLMEHFQKEFPGVFCTYPIIPYPKTNRTNYGLVIHYGSEAVKRKAAVAAKNAEKAAAAARRAKSDTDLVDTEFKLSPEDLVTLNFADKKGEELEKSINSWVIELAILRGLSPEAAAKISETLVGMFADDLVTNQEKRLSEPLEKTVCAGAGGGR